MPEYKTKLLKAVSQSSIKYQFFNHRINLEHCTFWRRAKTVNSNFLRTNFVRKTRQKLVIKIRRNKEQFEAGKFKKKKKINITIIYFF